MTAFNSKWKYENLTVVVRVPQTYAELDHFTFLFCRDSKEMYKDLYGTCTVIVFLIKSFVWRRSLLAWSSCFAQGPLLGVIKRDKGNLSAPYTCFVKKKKHLQ